MSAKDQVHSKFKVFAGKLGAGGSLGALLTDVPAFVKSANAAAKSIGVEYLEHSNEVVVSVGYRDDEPSYPVKLVSTSLGVFKSFAGDESKALEAKMSEAAKNTPNIICHELFVTADREFFMVFMTQG